MNILIAEDAPSDRMLLRLYLEKLGNQVVEVKNGEDLVKVFFETPQAFDLLVVDLNMPFMSGEEAIRVIRESQGNYDENWIPIIILSGSESDEDILRCIESGADDYLTKPISHKVLSAKLLAMRRLDDMRKRLIAMNSKLEALSTTDYLTNLPNRRSFEKTLMDEMAKADRYKQPLSVAVLDIDHFKDINDTFGHDGGDEVLRELSRRLMKGKRMGDSFGRIGGEEFGLCIPHTNSEDAALACERYRHLLTDKPYFYEGKEIPLTVSVGVSTYEEETSQLDLIKCADTALYQAKKMGRDRVVVNQ